MIDKNKKQNIYKLFLKKMTWKNQALARKVWLHQYLEQIKGKIPPEIDEIARES